MQTKQEFKSRKEAVEYLRQRGFYKIGTSLGDTVMRNPDFENKAMQCRLISKLNNGKWHISHFEPILIATCICFKPITMATVKCFQ